MEGGKKEEEKRRRIIVVAVDESEESMYALSWCLANLLSNQNNTTTTTTTSSTSSIDTTLILLYVKPPPPVYSSLDATDLNRSNGCGSRVTLTQSQDVVATMEKYGKGLVNSVMSRAESVFREYDAIYNIKVEKKIGSGEAKDVICSAVQKLEADILVMGSHDYGFFKRALLGSVSDYCAKNVKCPVVVVKRPKNM